MNFRFEGENWVDTHDREAAKMLRLPSTFHSHEVMTSAQKTFLVVEALLL